MEDTLTSLLKKLPSLLQAFLQRVQYSISLLSNNMSAQEKKIKDVNALIERFDSMKKQEKMDLSSDQDLTIAIMNLISIEEHLVFSGGKTGKTHFYDLVEEVREMRKNLLKTIIKEYEGEVWCISKHLLAASMRLMEVGTKAQSMKKPDEAYDYFDKAYDLYALFWGLQMNVIQPGTLRDIPLDNEEKVSSNDITPENTNIETAETPVSTIRLSEEAGTSPTKKRSGLMGKLGELVQKSIDCCIE